MFVLSAIRPQRAARALLCALPMWALAPWLAGPAAACGAAMTAGNTGPGAPMATPMPPLPPGTFRGEFLGPGVECVQLRLDSGEQISLEGADFSAVVPGTMLRLTGDFARMSRCMQGRALIVRQFSTEPPP